MNRILLALFALLATPALAVDNQQSCSGNSCKVVLMPRTSGGTATNVESCTSATCNFAALIDPVGGFGTTTDGAAGASASGLVTTGTQTFAGAKTFASSTQFAVVTDGTTTITTFDPYTGPVLGNVLYFNGSGTITMHGISNGQTGQQLSINNNTGHTLTINCGFNGNVNDFTCVSSPISLSNGGSATFGYIGTRWRAIDGH